jgi:hypothetical protein
MLQGGKSCGQQGISANDPVNRVLALKNFFVSEKWRRPYAEALQETDVTKLLTLIADAEDAIFDRHLELCVSPGSTEQSLDLQQAISVLAQLKKRHVAEHGARETSRREVHPAAN